MKRFITLALALCMVFGAALNASAAEIKASGNMWVGYNYLNVDNEGKTTDFKQRFRTQIDIVASEALSGTVFFEINNTWGHAKNNIGNGSGGALGADGVNIQTRRAYLDFVIPTTPIKIRAGLQGVALPGAVAGNVVLNDDLGAIVASASYSVIDFTAFYGRPYDAYDPATNYDESESSVDVYGLIASMNFDSFTVSPYFLAANVGEDAAIETVTTGNGLNGDAQWIGVAVEATPIENLVLSFDGVFGKTSDRDGGLLLAGKAAYTTQYCVPALMAWYATGNDGNDNEGRMPIVDNGGDFAATTLLGEGAVGPMSDYVFGNVLGKWGIALQAEDITFIENVSHRASITYMRGTNDDDSALLDQRNWSDDDSAVEIDFVTTYSMYDNLDLIADLAFAATDFDNDNAMAEDIDNVFKAAILAVYSF
ncbi:outer membrane homotrimeric porin [Halodesulfovibrio aestuarii]|uniref:outer membrane homotrimeric porin n=1 Tax=Halodesulfovibrio aestuarii TaxID=126333 RepID=UPI003D3295B2